MCLFFSVHYFFLIIKTNFEFSLLLNRALCRGLFLMPFLEDLDTFFIDFTDSVIYDNAEYKGILEQPDEIIADNTVMTTDYELTGKTSDFGRILFDESIQINQENYTVRSVRKIDDGSLCIVSLTKTEE